MWAALLIWPPQPEIGEKAEGRYVTLHGTVDSKEYALRSPGDEVYIRLNLYEDMDIPEHELLGPLPGYLAKQRNGFYWLINSAEVKGNKANVEFVNDYGSEDLSATLRMPNDSTLVLEQGRGSSIKVPKNGKWFKLPSKITFKRK